MAFSDKTLDFLQENSLRDSKEWFNEHRQEFTEQVVEPFTDFILRMQPCMNKIDSEIICNPKKLSRIYRDTRFSKNKTVFRANMWYSFGRRRSSDEIVPEFYFDLSPDGYSYGCGYYQAGTKRMETFREMILQKDPAFTAAQAAFEQQDVFQLCGEEYKKNHFPDCDEKIARWLNRKNLYLSKSSIDFDTLYRVDLPDLISTDFLKITEVYRFFLEVEKRANS